MREIDHLSVDETKWLNELVEEALRDLHKNIGRRRKPLQGRSNPPSVNGIVEWRLP
jgi:hypothetical protein